MKRYFLKTVMFMMLFLALPGSLAGCGRRTDTLVTVEHSDTDLQDNSQTTEEATAFPGSYAVPENWIKVEKYSTVDKFFYVEEGHEEDKMPDNISIEIGTNRYGEEEHEQFRDAVVRQLMTQLQGVDAELTGDGTYTQQGYVVYTFTITEADVVTKQYYIVGEQQYCLIHMTSFTGSDSVDQAAMAIVDSFTWN